MKHSSASDRLEPEQIGIEVRRIVDAFLHGTPHGTPNVAVGFSHRTEKLATEIARWGAKTNLTAHPGDPEEIAFHIVDSLAPLVQASSGLAPIGFGKEQRILDLGSGAGFPGLILAAACDAQFTLIEVRRKRASFLQVVAAAMQLCNVKVESRRAEVVVGESQFDLVTARAFGKLDDFLLLAGKALKPSGVAILYANPGQALSSEIATEAGLTNLRRVEYHIDRAQRECSTHPRDVDPRIDPQDVDDRMMRNCFPRMRGT